MSGNNDGLLVPEDLARQMAAQQQQMPKEVEQPHSYLSDLYPLNKGVSGITLLQDQIIIKYEAKTTYKGILLFNPAKVRTEQELNVGTIIEKGNGEFIEELDLDIGMKVIVGQFSGIILEGLYGEHENEDEDGEKITVFYRLCMAKDVLGLPRYTEQEEEPQEEE